MSNATQTANVESKPETLSRVDMLRKLTLTPEQVAQGDWVRSSLIMGHEEGFKNVAKEWLAKCWSYSQAQEELSKDKRTAVDHTIAISALRPKITDNGQFVFVVGEFGEFAPTAHAMSQIGGWLDLAGARAIGSLPRKLVGLTSRKLGDQSGDEITRDNGDKETAITVLNNGFRHIPADKKLLVRCWQGENNEIGTMRAVLSDGYKRISLRESLSIYADLLPGGMVSHWRGDADNLRANILIPDSLTKPDDDGNQFGTMVSVTNSEIGQLLFSSLPSMFSAICRNGCIWGQEKGEILKIKHKGAEDYESVKKLVGEWIAAQLPMSEKFTQLLIESQRLGDMQNGESMLPVLAEVAISEKLGKAEVGLLVKGYAAAKELEPRTLQSLYGVINVITRAGQGTPSDTLDFDVMAGRYLRGGADGWQTLLNRARQLKGDKVREALYLAS